MNSPSLRSRLPLLVSVGLAAGAAIATLDNVPFEGEMSPIVVVALLFSATAAAGRIWGRGGGIASLVAGACVPGVHLVKHILGLPDTLHPNTYASILKLAAFTLTVAAIGTGCGLLFRRRGATAATRDQ